MRPTSQSFLLAEARSSASAASVRQCKLTEADHTPESLVAGITRQGSLVRSGSSASTEVSMTRWPALITHPVPS